LPGGEEEGNETLEQYHLYTLIPKTNAYSSPFGILVA